MCLHTVFSLVCAVPNHYTCTLSSALRVQYPITTPAQVPILLSLDPQCVSRAGRVLHAAPFFSSSPHPQSYASPIFSQLNSSFFSRLLTMLCTMHPHMAAADRDDT